MQRRFHAGLSLALAFGAASACRRPALVVVRDLAAELSAAELSGEPAVILFGTPAAEAHQERGVVRETGDVQGGRFAVAEQEAQLLLRWPDARARELVLDLSPAPGLRRQAVDVRLNRAHVAHVRFDARSRHAIALPAELQQAGDNRVSLSFDRPRGPQDPGAPRLAARLHSLSAGAAGSPVFAALAATDSLPVLEARTTDGLPSIVQMSGGRIRYALRIPAGAELRVAPSVAAASRAPARLAIEVEASAGDVRELWGRELQAGERLAEIGVGLSSLEGRTVRAALRVEAEGAAWAVWGAPRILAPAPPRPAPDPRTADLRASLRGANVVLVVLDAAGARHFSCYGYERLTTPEIDRIAAEGVLFERAYTTAVYTLAAMGSLWTSRPPDENLPPGRGLRKLPTTTPTLAEQLSLRGVPSAGFVANARAGRAYGLDRGFGEFHEVLTDGVGLAEVLRSSVVDWLRAQPDAPFFLYVHFREPHFPYDPPAPFDTRFGPAGPLPPEARREQGFVDRVNAGSRELSAEELAHLVRLYDGNLAFADQQVGALRRALEASGRWERTVLIVTGDHGDALQEHGYIGHNRQVHEESTHIPLVVRFPHGAKLAGVRVAAMTDLLDLAPTVADIFGLDAAAERHSSGTSLLPLALGGAGREFVVTRSATGERPTYALRDGRFTLIRSLRYAKDRLFDAQRDPLEREELSGRLPLEAAYARARLFLWLTRLRQGPADAGEAQLTPEQLQNLRALGYLN